MMRIAWPITAIQMVAINEIKRFHLCHEEHHLDRAAALVHTLGHLGGRHVTVAFVFKNDAED